MKFKDNVFTIFLGFLALLLYNVMALFFVFFIFYFYFFEGPPEKSLFIECGPLNKINIINKLINYYLFRYNYQLLLCSKNTILISCWLLVVGFPVPCMQKNLKIFGMWTVKWLSLLLFSGVQFC